MSVEGGATDHRWFTTTWTKREVGGKDPRIRQKRCSVCAEYSIAGKILLCGVLTKQGDPRGGRCQYKILNVEGKEGSRSVEKEELGSKRGGLHRGNSQNARVE